MIQLIKNTFQTLLLNPKFFFRRLIKGLRAFLFFPISSVAKSLNGVFFSFDFFNYPQTKRMYVGAYELNVCETIETILCEGDTFIDVGANIGYITALGAGLVGKKGKVHSFEPVPKYFQELEKLAIMNKEYKIIPNRCALGDREGTLEIYVTDEKNMGESSAVQGFLPQKYIRGCIRVPVRRLDSYIAEEKVKNIKLIKIDVEGFEFPVLKGLEEFFLTTFQLPYIICEVSYSAFSLLGYKLTDLFQYMKRFSYLPFETLNPKKKVDEKTVFQRRYIDVLFKSVKSEQRKV